MTHPLAASWRDRFLDDWLVLLVALAILFGAVVLGLWWLDVHVCPPNAGLTGVCL